MAVFPIRLFGDPVLRERAREVELVDGSIQKLMRDLVETMMAAPGVGLAAPQIGVRRRVIVWQNEDERGALANPRIVDRRGRMADDEACLSLPGLTYPVSRAQWIAVTGLGEEGEEVSIEASDLTARILQHEIDHLDGVLFIDHLSADMQRAAKRLLREQALSGFTPSASSAIL